MVEGAYIGIDLSLMHKKPSTVSILIGKTLFVRHVSSVKKIVGLIRELKPKCIAIDSPLQLPKKGAYRDCEIQMKKMGLKPLPVTWRYMKELTIKAIEIKKKLRGFSIIETFPTGALRLKGLTKYNKNIFKQYSVYVNILAEMNIKLISKVIFNKDVLDSLICAIAAKYYYEKIFNRYLEIEGNDCKIIIPII